MIIDRIQIEMKKISFYISGKLLHTCNNQYRTMQYNATVNTSYMHRKKSTKKLND